MRETERERGKERERREEERRRRRRRRGRRDGKKRIEDKNRRAEKAEKPHYLSSLSSYFSFPFLSPLPLSPPLSYYPSSLLPRLTLPLLTLPDSAFPSLTPCIFDFLTLVYPSHPSHFRSSHSHSSLPFVLPFRGKLCLLLPPGVFLWPPSVLPRPCQLTSATCVILQQPCLRTTTHCHYTVSSSVPPRVSYQHTSTRADHHSGYFDRL